MKGYSRGLMLIGASFLVAGCGAKESSQSSQSSSSSETSIVDKSEKLAKAALLGQHIDSLLGYESFGWRISAADDNVDSHEFAFTISEKEGEKKRQYTHAYMDCMDRIELKNGAVLAPKYDELKMAYDFSRVTFGVGTPGGVLPRIVDCSPKAYIDEGNAYLDLSGDPILDNILGTLIASLLQDETFYLPSKSKFEMPEAYKELMSFLLPHDDIALSLSKSTVEAMKSAIGEDEKSIYLYRLQDGYKLDYSPSFDEFSSLLKSLYEESEYKEIVDEFVSGMNKDAYKASLSFSFDETSFRNLSLDLSLEAKEKEEDPALEEGKKDARIEEFKSFIKMEPLGLCPSESFLPGDLSSYREVKIV